MKILQKETKRMGKKQREMINNISVFLFYPYLLLLLIACNGQKEYKKEYKKLNDIMKINDNSLHYEQSKKEFTILDSLQIGYIGINDSLTIKVDNQIVFNGITNYEPKNGYGSRLCYIKRENISEYFELKIEFHNLKSELIHTIDLNQYNSILVENGMNYGIPELKEFPEDLMIHLYKEEVKFY